MTILDCFLLDRLYHWLPRARTGIFLAFDLMDPLSDVLDLNCVRGRWWRALRACVPWGLDLPQLAGAAFHAITSGTAFEARFLGRSLAYTYEIRELEPGVRLVMSTDEGPFAMEKAVVERDWQIA